jgi:uncharacterized metal-binding protein YceD (DUF177 family)
MPIKFNIRHLEENDLTLQGELSAAELALEHHDELVRAIKPLKYDLTAQKMGNDILVQGRLELLLDCECSRCLKPVEHMIELPDWAVHLPLEGPEKASVNNDCVDLTPYIREDILLELPQHPLCGSNCAGLPKGSVGIAKKPKGAGQTEASSAWSELNKLKF